MCAKVGLKGKFTNHSLCATSVSRMYENDIPKQVITEITGHHSECVRVYKKTSNEMLEAASKTISHSKTDKNEVEGK